MPSLTVDLLLCVVLLGGAYILFGRQGASSTSTSASKKKKRSKTSKKQTKAEIPLSNLESQAANRILHAKSGTAAPEHTNGRTSNSQSDDKARAASKTKSASNTGAQNGRTSQVDQEDFPPLSVAASSKAPITNASSTRATKQVPLAERLAKTRPQTAVDDMVEKDDILQGEKVYSRTMRIVKPSETKPLLLDEDDDAWEQPRQEQTGDSTWQSVPIASKRASTIRLSSTPSSQSSQPAVSRSVPGLPELTKKQRQNARKAADMKAAKEEAEHERLHRLAAHKRALEKERTEEQHKPKSRQNAPQAPKTKREDVGGGMRAAVYDGKLIWE